MPAELMSGRALSQSILQLVRRRVEACVSMGKPAPSLAVLCVGDRQDSQAYIRAKRAAALSCGIRFQSANLPADSSISTVLGKIDEFNDSPEVSGFIVQLPLPAHLDLFKVISRIRMQKDVDGLHPENFGAHCGGFAPLLRPCTALAIDSLLSHYSIPLAGRNVTILNRSRIVGMPSAAMFLQKNATVSVCHRQTTDLARILRESDIIVSATGSRGVIRPEFVKPGVTLVDVGICRALDGKVVGDLDREAFMNVAGHISVVPGGVGPLTVAFLMQNTLISYLTSQN